MPEANNNDKSTNNKDIRELLEKNLELTEEIYKMSRSVRNYVITQRIFGVLKFLIIVVPIILAFIYLPPLVKGAIAPYQELLKDSPWGNLIPAGSKLDLGSIDPSKLTPDKIQEIQRILK